VAKPPCGRCEAEGAAECPEHGPCPPCRYPGDCACDEALRIQDELEAKLMWWLKGRDA
jgi:hypothetical protein